MRTHPHPNSFAKDTCISLLAQAAGTPPNILPSPSRTFPRFQDPNLARVLGMAVHVALALVTVLALVDVLALVGLMGQPATELSKGTKLHFQLAEFFLWSRSVRLVLRSTCSQLAK